MRLGESCQSDEVSMQPRTCTAYQEIKSPHLANSLGEPKEEIAMLERA